MQTNKTLDSIEIYNYRENRDYFCLDYFFKELIDEILIKLNYNLLMIKNDSFIIKTNEGTILIDIIFIYLEKNIVSSTFIHFYIKNENYYEI